MTIHFHALPTDAVRAIQSGGPDFWGAPAEQAISDGSGIPCRHCLRQIPAGQPYLIAAWRPFPTAQPYAEVGPIFLCADPCTAPFPSAETPEFLCSESYLIKGYTADYRIRYGTGAITTTAEIPAAAIAIFDDLLVAFIDVRSARNNCFHTRITRT